MSGRVLVPLEALVLHLCTCAVGEVGRRLDMVEQNLYKHITSLICVEWVGLMSVLCKWKQSRCECIKSNASCAFGRSLSAWPLNFLIQASVGEIRFRRAIELHSFAP